MLLNPHVHVLLPRTWSLFNSLVCHVLVWQPLEIGKIDRYPHPSLPALIHGRKNKLLHVACSTKTLHVCVTYSLWQAEITRNREKVVNRLRSPRVSPHYCFIGGVKFPQGEGSAVIHRKKNDLLHKDATYMYVCVTYRLRKGEFTRNTKTGRKQAQDPPGSLHTIVSSVEWSSLKGRGLWWFTKKNDLLKKRKKKKERTTHYVCVTASGRVN